MGVICYDSDVIEYDKDEDTRAVCLMQHFK